MTSAKTRIINKTGLHARPATEFVTLAKQYDSHIEIKNLASGETANAKSIVFLLTLLLKKGTEVEVNAEGADEKEAVAALTHLIERGLGESEE